MVGSASPSAKPQRCPSDACVATTSPRSQRSPQTASPSPGSSGPLQQTQPPDHEDQENRDAPSMLASFPPADILNHKSPPSGIPSDSDFRKCALAASVPAGILRTARCAAGSAGGWSGHVPSHRFRSSGRRRSLVRYVPVADVWRPGRVRRDPTNCGHSAITAS